MTEKQWVPATPLDAIQDPPLRCRVRAYGKTDEWVESVLLGYDRSQAYCWSVANVDIQWAQVCEVQKQNPPAHNVEVDDPGCQATPAETLAWVKETLEARGK